MIPEYFINQKYIGPKESYAVPFNEVRRLISVMEYATGSRVAVILIASGGMRVSEIEQLTIYSFPQGVMTWQPGKGQKGIRKVKLADWVLWELYDYIMHHRTAPGIQLFNFNSNTLNRYINQKIRPKLGGLWMVRTSRRGSQKGKEYLYQLKGLRHNWSTLRYANLMKEWGETMAVNRTCLDMKHSSYHMTMNHYIQNFDVLDIKKYMGLDMGEIIKQPLQTRLNLFLIE